MMEINLGSIFYKPERNDMSRSAILGNAYFIHPYAGQVIYVPHSHISLVISNPEKFRVNFEFIKTIYEKYGEKIGIKG